MNKDDSPSHQDVGAIEKDPHHIIKYVKNMAEERDVKRQGEPNRLEQWGLRQSSHVMNQPILGMLRNLERLDSKLSPTGPPDYRFLNLNTLLVREGDVQGEDFSSTHGQISRKPPATQGQVPDGAGSGIRADAVLHKALHRKATIGANREGHECLGGWVNCRRRILETQCN